jgi:hypothetical protein
MSRRSLFRRKASSQNSVASGSSELDTTSRSFDSPRSSNRRSDDLSDGSGHRRANKGRQRYKRSSRSRAVAGGEIDDLDRPIPRTHKSRELLDAFLEQIEKDLQEKSIGSSALKQLHDIKAQLAADEEKDKDGGTNSTAVDDSGSMNVNDVPISNISVPSDERPVSRSHSSEGESRETSKAGNRDKRKGRSSRADSNAAETGETMPTTVDTTQMPEDADDDDEEDSIQSSSLSEDSDITGLTGVFSSTGQQATGAAKKPKRSSLDSLDAVLERPEDAVEKKTSHPEPLQERDRKVGFQSVYVRTYERILENNPSCTSGPSIGIGWNYDIEQEFFVDDFERIREGERKGDLVLSREEREDMLLDLGYTERELAQAVRTMIKQKNQRRQTVQNLSTSGAEEMLENAGRRVRKLLGRKSKSKRTTAIP